MIEAVFHTLPAGQRLGGFLQIAERFLGGAQKGALVRQLLFLARLRVQPVQFRRGVFEIVAFGFGAAARLLQRLRLLPGIRQRVIGGAHGPDLFIMAAIGVQQTPVGPGVEQAAAVMLAVNLHQRLADLFEQADAGRFIIDEGAAAAIGVEGAAQDQFAAIQRETALVQKGAGGVIISQGEHGGRRRGVITADQRLVGALPGRQAQRIQNDGFARAGFARQGAQTGVELYVRAVDQHDVSYGKRGQHLRPPPLTGEKAGKLTRRFARKRGSGNSRPARRPAHWRPAQRCRDRSAARSCLHTRGCPDSYSRAPRRPDALPRSRRG